MSERRRTRGKTPDAAAPPAAPDGSIVRVAALTHDIERRRSIATLVWTVDAEKRLAVPVPFGCPIETVEERALEAVRHLAAELSSLHIVPSAGTGREGET